MSPPLSGVFPPAGVHDGTRPSPPPCVTQGFHKALVNRPQPWQQMVREDSVKKAAGGGKAYALTVPGRAAAARLHAEAEAAGFCSCGRVAKAKVSPQLGAGAGNPLGLREERLATIRQLLSDEGWRAREAWERRCVAWERDEIKHQAALRAWEEARGGQPALTAHAAPAVHAALGPQPGDSGVVASRCTGTDGDGVGMVGSERGRTPPPPTHMPMHPDASVA